MAKSLITCPYENFYPSQVPRAKVFRQTGEEKFDAGWVFKGLRPWQTEKEFAEPRHHELHEL